MGSLHCRRTERAYPGGFPWRPLGRFGPSSVNFLGGSHFSELPKFRDDIGTHGVFGKIQK